MGSAKAHFLSFITAPPNKAIAICGAKPQGRLGTIRYKAAITIKTTIVRISDLLDFMFIFLLNKNRKIMPQGKQRLNPGKPLQLAVSRNRRTVNLRGGNCFQRNGRSINGGKGRALVKPLRACCAVHFNRTVQHQENIQRSNV